MKMNQKPKHWMALLNQRDSRITAHMVQPQTASTFDCFLDYKSAHFRHIKHLFEFMRKFHLISKLYDVAGVDDGPTFIKMRKLPAKFNQLNYCTRNQPIFIGSGICSAELFRILLYIFDVTLLLCKWINIFEHWIKQVHFSCQ